MRISDFIVKEGIQGAGVFATKEYQPGEVLFRMQGEMLSQPTRTSIQVGMHRHVEDKVGVHVNHHCQPNARVNQKMMTMVALKAIKAGEEITFDYNQNEDYLANPFVCRCCERLMEGKRAKMMKSAAVK